MLYNLPEDGQSAAYFSVKSVSLWDCCRWFGDLSLQIFLLALLQILRILWYIKSSFFLAPAKVRQNLFWKIEMKILSESSLQSMDKILWVKTFCCWKKKRKKKKEKKNKQLFKATKSILSFLPWMNSIWKQGDNSSYILTTLYYYFLKNDGKI